MEEAGGPLMAYRDWLRSLLLAEEVLESEGYYSGRLISALQLHLHKQQAYIEYEQTSARLAAMEDETARNSRQVLLQCFQGADLRYYNSPAVQTPSPRQSPSSSEEPHDHHHRVGPSL